MRSTSGIAFYHLCNEVATKIGPEGTQIQGASHISVCGGTKNKQETYEFPLIYFCTIYLLKMYQIDAEILFSCYYYHINVENIIYRLFMY